MIGVIAPVRVSDPHLISPDGGTNHISAGHHEQAMTAGSMIREKPRWLRI
jgi:hypothetical protein